MLARMNWKYVSYSVSTGVVVTALSYMFYKEGGELVLWPGTFMELVVNGVMLFVIQSDDFYSLPSGTYLVFNTAFYALVIFIILSVIIQLGSAQRRPPP